MANFFDPSNETKSSTTTTTPSPAAQAMAKYRADILGRLLDYASSRGPSFKQFTKGADLRAPLPGGLSSGIGALLAAMNEPGAFTSTATAEGELTPSSPSMFSDLAQLGLLGGLLYQSGALGAGADAVGKILSMLGGAQGIGGVNPALGDVNPEDVAAYQDLAPLFETGNQMGQGSYGVLASDAGSDDYLASLLGLL